MILTVAFLANVAGTVSTSVGHGHQIHTIVKVKISKFKVLTDAMEKPNLLRDKGGCHFWCSSYRVKKGVMRLKEYVSPCFNHKND